MTNNQINLNKQMVSALTYLHINIRPGEIDDGLVIWEDNEYIFIDFKTKGIAKRACHNKYLDTAYYFTIKEEGL